MTSPEPLINLEKFYIKIGKEFYIKIRNEGEKKKKTLHKILIFLGYTSLIILALVSNEATENSH